MKSGSTVGPANGKRITVGDDALRNRAMPKRAGEGESREESSANPLDRNNSVAAFRCDGFLQAMALAYEVA